MTERKFVETLMARGFVSHATLRSAFTRDNVEVRVVSTKAMVLSGDGSAKWAPFDEALARLGIGAAGPFQMGSRVWPGLGKLVEEAGEVIQVAGKLVATGGEAAYWDGSDLRARLEEEIADLQAAAQFVAEECGLGLMMIAARREEKLETFRRWHRGEERL